ncbi:hypothetical protein CRENBAI_000665 [Crenichthys baileyi]|uniref:Uncharacterized protein n=1 Tax=Crenichthys baileyi TaxID=28760 RepID=A0AAV9R3X6_9TELE
MDEGKTVEDAEIIQSSRCLVTVVIPASFLKENPKYLERFSCKLKDDDTKIDQLFAHSPQSSGNDANTTKPDGRKTDVTVPAIRDTPTTPLNLWLYIVVTLGVVAPITTVVVIILWIRREDSIMLQDEEQILNSAVVSSNPETSPNMAYPEDEVSYATICHIKKAESTIWVRDGEEAGDSVTYSSVKVYSAEVSPDPDNLYETINKSNEKET